MKGTVDLGKSFRRNQANNIYLEIAKKCTRDRRSQNKQVHTQDIFYTTLSVGDIPGEQAVYRPSSQAEATASYFNLAGNSIVPFTSFQRGLFCSLTPHPVTHSPLNTPLTME